MTVLTYFCAIVPILLFLLVLLLMDGFALTSGKRLTICIVAGIVCCLLCKFIYFIFGCEGNKLIASFVEEFLKGSLLLWMAARKRIGLLGDATIYGSAIGVGFALADNILTLASHSGISATHSILLGFEAAVMHIGCTSLLAMVIIMAMQEKFGKSLKSKRLGMGAAFIAAIVVHYVHALEPLPPLILTSILVVYFGISKYSLFKKNERFIHEWIDMSIGTDVALLASMRRGELSETNAGKYLLSLKERFDGETFFDMLCYISEYLNLSISAKSNLILKEAGFEPTHSEEDAARLQELKALKKRIGATGELALAPIVNIKDVDRWAVNELI